MSKNNEILDSFYELLSEADAKKELEKLYGLKPGDYKYKKNLVEVAHPEMQVLLPAYDKLNGLVENLNEGQTALLHIVNQPSTGHLVHKKYAETELLKSLIRVANVMDSKDIDELRILADACIEEMEISQIKKEAVGPLAIAAVGAAIVGAIYAQQHLDAKNVGFEENSQKLIIELNKFLTSGEYVGNTYKDEFKAQIGEDIRYLQAAYAAYQKQDALIRQIEKPRTRAELAQLAATPAGMELKKAHDEFKAMMDNLLPLLAKMKENFANESYKARQVKEKGFFNEMNDMLGGVFYGGKTSLISDNFNDVKRIIPAYEESVQDVLQILGQSNSVAETAKANLAQAPKIQEPEQPKAKPAMLSDEDLDKSLQEAEQWVKNFNPST